MAGKTVLSAKGLAAIASKGVATIPSKAPAPVAAPAAPTTHAPTLLFVDKGRKVEIDTKDWPLGAYVLMVSPMEAAQESGSGKSWDVAKINATFDNCTIPVNGVARPIRASGTFYVSKGLSKAEKENLELARAAKESA